VCELCGLVNDRKIATKKYYEDANFMMVDCKTCRVPMLVSKKHFATIDEADMAMAYHLFYKHAERISISGWFVDYKMRTIPEHWHAHLRRL